MLGMRGQLRLTPKDCLARFADADPDKRIVFEIDFPSEEKEFIPFLNSEIKIDPEGVVSSRLFRKPQKKLITPITSLITLFLLRLIL